MKTELIQFAKEIQELLKTKNLREISQWSFQQRESGRNVPYLEISQYGNKKEVTGLTARPTSKQKDLKQFFNELRAGSKVMPRFIFRVSIEEGVEFFEVKEKGGEKINLI